MLRDFSLKFKDLFTTLSLFVFSLYTAALLLPRIQLPVSNPYEIIGPLTGGDFNPVNDYLRFAFLVLFTPLLFLFLTTLVKKKRSWVLRAIFVVVLALSFLTSQTKPFILSKKQNLDMFHDGEQLGTGSAMYFFDQKPFQDIFFLHGVFSDPLLAYASFKTFGVSIGSFLFVSWVITLVSFFAALIILGTIFNSGFLFYLSALFLFGSFPTYSLGRDLPIFLYILLAYLIGKGRLNPKIGFLLTSFLSFFSIYISAERGIYLFLANLLFFITYIFVTEKFWSVRWKEIPAVTYRIFSTVISLLSGTLVAVASGILFFGWEPFREFLQVTFVTLPKVSPLLFDFRYPLPSPQSLAPYWWPIILIVANLTFLLFYFIRNKDQKIDPSFLFPTAAAILSTVLYRIALGRNDAAHILYVAPYVLLSSFLVLDFLLKVKKDTLKTVVAYALAIFLALLPFSDYQRLLTPLNEEVSGLKLFLTLPSTPDEFWLTEEQIATQEFIRQNTNKEDYVFVFTNESAYYYLFQRKNPTRFYTIWFATPNFYQEEVIADLNKNKPKYIIYQSNFWSSALPQPKKVNEWILANYTPDKPIGSTQILKLVQHP